MYLLNCLLLLTLTYSSLGNLTAFEEERTPYIKTELRLDGTDPGTPADFQCRGEIHHHQLANEERAWDRDRSSAPRNF